MLATALLVPALCFQTASAALDARRLGEIVGIAPVAKEGELKVSVPQTELPVEVDGFPIVPAMGLTSWVAFSEHKGHAMAMGDLVLLESEVGPVQRAAVKAGLTVTALHNHFLRDRPKVMFMHVGGAGDFERLASSVRSVLDAVRDLRAARPAGAARKAESALDAAALGSILGQAGELKDGVYKVVVGRPDVSLKEGGAPVGTFLGFNTWMAFQGSDRKAAVSGDFAMLESEVQAVIGALVEAGLEVTAVHNHMVAERPRVFFLHFWGVGPAADLARGLRAALDRTGRRR